MPIFIKNTSNLIILSEHASVLHRVFVPIERKEILEEMKLAGTGHWSFWSSLSPDRGYFYRKCGHWQEGEKLNTNL